jgi:intein/homing endonuclease/phage-related protein
MADLAILAKLEDNASKGLANIEGQLKGLESSATSFATKGFANLETAMKAAAVAGAAAFAAVSAGAIKLGVDGVKAFADFQGGMNEVFTLMPGMSQDAMSQMSNDVLAFGQSIGKTSDEIIPALYQAISAGVPADNVFSFMETANAAAVGGVTDLETAVDGITSVVNAYGADVMSAAQASDLMFTAVRLGKCVTGDTRVLLADGRYVRIDELEEGADVVSYDGRTFQVRPATWVDQGVKPTVKLTTRLGREITTTWNHPYLAHKKERGLRSNARPEWTKVSDLQVGDRIAVPAALPYFGDVDVPEHEAAFLGLWLAEGAVQSGSPKITTTLYGDQIATWADKFGCVANNTDKREGAAPVYQFTKGYRGGRERTRPQELLIELGLNDVTSATKHIPEQVFTWKRERIATMLHWLFNGDGWLNDVRQQNRSGFQLGFISKSEQLVRDVNHLLLRFGIVGRIRRRENCWVWEVNRHYEISRFVRFIGIDRPAAERVASHVPEKQKASFDVVEYDRIVSIEAGPEQHVYDLCVDELHNFVANDIVAHNTDFSQLSASLFQVTPTAAALGVGFGDVTAALASLTAQGVPTSVATTQMRQMFIELSKEGGKTSATFQELAGQSFKDFIASGGNVADALEILEAHAIETGVGVNDLFGSVEAGAAALGLTGSSMEGFRANLAAMDESAGATQAAYEQMKTGMQLVFDIIGATVDNFKIRIGAALAPFVDELAPKIAAFAQDALPKLETAFKAVTEVIALFTGLGSDSIDTLDNMRDMLFNLGLTSTQVDALETAVRNVADAIKSFIANLQEGMSPMDAFLEAIWDLVPPETALAMANLRDTVVVFVEKVQTAAQPIIDFIARNIELKDALFGIGIAIATAVLPILFAIAAPILSAILAISAAIAIVALLRSAWENDFLGIRTAAENAFEFLRGAFENIQNAIGIFKDAIEGGAKPVDALRESFGVFGEGVQKAFDVVVNAVGGAFDFIQGVFEKIQNAMFLFEFAISRGAEPVEALGFAIAVFGEDAKGVFDNVMNAVDALVKFFEPTIERIKEAFAGLGESMGENSGVIDGLKAAFERVLPILETIAGVIGAVLVAAVKLLMELFGQLIENAGQIFGGLVQIVTGALDAVASVVEGVVGIVKAIIDGDWTAAWQIFKDTVSNVKDAIGTALAGVLDVIDGIFGAIWDTIANFVTDLGGTAVTWDEFKTNISTAFEEAKTAVTTALTDALAAVTGFVTDITQAGRDIINGLIGGIEEKKEAVKTKITDIIGSIPDAVKKLLGIASPSRVFAAIGSFIMDGLAIGIVEGADGPVAAIRTAVGDIKLTAMNEIAEMVVNVTSAIHPAIAALNQLANFSIDPRVGENTSQFMFYLRHLVASVVVMAFELDGARNKTLKMAQIINEIVGSVGSGITSFNQLARMAFPPSLLPNIDQFAGAVGVLAFQFASIADQLETELIVKAQALADMTGYLFGVISVVLDGSRALANMDFAAVVSGPYGTLANQIVIFRNIVRTLVREFAEAALELGGFADFVSAFGEAASKVVGLVADGLEAAKALAQTDFGALVNGPYNHLATQIVTFRNIIRTLIREFALAAADFSEGLMDSVSNFTDAAGDIVGLVADALAATTLLAEFDFVTAVGGMKLAENILIFRNIVNTLVARFAEVAAGFSVDLANEVKAFADAAGEVLDLIKPGIEGIVALTEYTGVAELGAKVDVFGNDLYTAVTKLATKLREIAAALNGAIAEAAAIAADAGTILDVVGPAIDALAKLAEYEAVQGLAAKMDIFTTDLGTAVATLSAKLNQIKNDIGGDVVTAAAFATDVSSIFEEVAKALDGLEKIAAAQTPDTAPKMDYLVVQANLIATTLSGANQTINGTIVAAAKAFAAAVNEVVGEVIEALASLNRLVTANTPGGLQAILDAMRAALSNQIGPAGVIGREIGNAFATGLMAEMQSLLNQLSGTMNALLAILRSGVGPAGQAGTDLGRMFASALSAQQGAAATAGALIGNAAADGMKNALGKQAGNIANAARDMARQAADSARRELDIHSPSRVFARIGEQAGQGFTLGLPTINAAAYAGAGASSATTNNVRQGDSISIHISVGGNVSASTLRDVETAVQRGLNSAGRSAESRRRR